MSIIIYLFKTVDVQVFLFLSSSCSILPLGVCNFECHLSVRLYGEVLQFLFSLSVVVRPGLSFNHSLPGSFGSFVMRRCILDRSFMFPESSRKEFHTVHMMSNRVHRSASRIKRPAINVLLLHALG